MTKASWRLGVAAVAAVALVGCGSADGQAGADAGDDATRVVATDFGDVAVPVGPERVVVLNGSLVGYAYDLDVPVVAVDPRMIGVNTEGGSFTEHVAEDAGRQGTALLPAGDQLSLEAITSHAPDLILGGGQGYTGVMSVDAYDDLSKIAPTVLVSQGAVGWRSQLEAVADAVGKQDRVEALIERYNDKVAEAKAAINAPEGRVAYLLTTAQPGAVTLVTPTAALPSLLAEVGFVPDSDVRAKAGDPDLFGSGDSFQFSPELLRAAVDAEVVVVIRLDGGASADDLAADPLYAGLPAFQGGKVYELPAWVFRPDFRLALDTLDLVAEQFGK